MPILLDNLSAQAHANIKTYTPTFFDSKLTGSGKSTGLLNAANVAGIIPTTTVLSTDALGIRKCHVNNGGTDVRIIPVSPLPYDVFAMAATRHWKFPMPDARYRRKIGTHQTHNDVHIYTDMPLYSVTLEETKKPDGTTEKSQVYCFRLCMYRIKDGNEDLPAETEYHMNYAFAGNFTENKLYFDFTANPVKLLSELSNQLKSCGFDMDDAAIADYLSTYSLYDAVCRQSENWQEHMDSILNNWFANIVPTATNEELNSAALTLRYIETYPVPLFLYRNIYQNMTKQLSEDIVRVLCKQNLSLLLSDTLNSLETNKAALTHVVNPTPASMPQPKLNYSPEQIAAIQSEEPLILVQAGAGCGKSSLILGRIDHMIHSGIKPEDITVLSFTNAAANHIEEKCPKVHSMTIARMIHTIYSANYPTHELSSLETITNSLDIYFPHDPIARKFRGKLMDIAKCTNSSFNSMNNFIENNFDKVIAMLDTIRQVCLELEIILCYQQINNMIEPPEVQSKFLIIDEVQDNSIFEFIYMIQYVNKHQESLFIVGKLRLPTLNPTNCGNTTHSLCA